MLWLTKQDIQHFLEQIDAQSAQSNAQPPPDQGNEEGEEQQPEVSSVSPPPIERENASKGNHRPSKYAKDLIEMDAAIKRIMDGASEPN